MMDGVTVGDLVAWSGGRLASGFSGEPVRRVTHDTRSLRPGDVYVALKGGRFDGHDFAARALDMGAAGLVVSQPLAGAGRERVVIEVGGTLAALQDIAAGYRNRFQIPVVGITGSNGKTATKDLAAAALGAAMPVHATPGNWNNHVGVPLTLLQLDGRHRAAVLELAMNHPGEIARLAAVARPTVGVITNIGPAHLGLLGSEEAVLAAKWELIEALPADGIAVLNADDPKLAARMVSAARRVRVITFGLSGRADVRAEEVETTPAGTAFRLVVGGASCAVRMPLLGRFQVANALAAAAAGTALGVAPDVLARGLARVKPASQRMEIHEAGGITLVDDAYNANPASMRASLAGFGQLYPDRRRVLVLGDMLELGAFAEREHESLGSAAAATDPALIFALGERAEAVARGAQRAGLARDKIVVCRERVAAEAGLLRALRPGDAVLFKGSRGMKLEEVMAHVISSVLPAA